jgi:hypothetical protein
MSVELTYWVRLNEAIALATAMLFPQILTWISRPADTSAIARFADSSTPPAPLEGSPLRHRW